MIDNQFTEDSAIASIIKNQNLISLIMSPLKFSRKTID